MHQSREKGASNQEVGSGTAPKMCVKGEFFSFKFLTFAPSLSFLRTSYVYKVFNTKGPSIAGMTSGVPGTVTPSMQESTLSRL